MGTQLSPDRIPVMWYINSLHGFSGAQAYSEVVQRRDVGLVTNYTIKNAGAKKSANVLWEDITMARLLASSAFSAWFTAQGTSNSNKTVPKVLHKEAPFNLVFLLSFPAVYNTHSENIVQGTGEMAQWSKY